MQSTVCIMAFALVMLANLSSARSDMKLLSETGLFCVKEGLNSHPEDCTQFIVCSRNIEGGFNGAIYKCSDGEAFDEKTLTCVDADEEPGCRRRFARQASAVKPKTTTTTTTAEPPVDCHNKPILCRDCNTLSICIEKNNTFEHLTDIPCTENDQMAYCDEAIAACTSKIPPTCPSNFLCTGIGYFPDPSDCTKYQICHPENDKIIAATQYCGTNQVYSTSMKMCVVKRSVSDCHKVTCPSGNMKTLPFPGDASYYVICINGKPDFVFYCGESKQYNSVKNTCEVVCKEAGRMPDTDDCRKYYECTPNRIGGTFTLTSHTCPSGTVYDNTYQFCIAGSTCK